MLDALQTASAGMAAATRRFGDAAQGVANVGASVGSATLPPAAQADLSALALDLIGSEAAFALNAAVLRTADTMAGRLLDIAA